MDDEGWEARMAARARERRDAEDARIAAERDAIVATLTAEVERTIGTAPAWLNGWPQLGGGSVVLVGTAVHCVGCGNFKGITTVAFPEDWEPPGPEPDWPFSEADCRICELTRALP